MFSIWEHNSFLKCDVAIVGAGITGLSTAASLKEADPGLDIVVLERGLLPTGASTKNAGFACFGSLTELLADRQTMGEDRMLALVEKRWKGLEKTRQRLGEKAIDLQVNGGYELLDKSLAQRLPEMESINKALRSLFGADVFENQSQRMAEFGFQDFENLVFNRFEGQIDTGKLIANLWKYCSELGVRVHTGALVSDFKKVEDGVSLKVGGTRFSCKMVALCTNAFTNKLFPVEAKPGRGLVLAIQPEEALRFEGTFHYDEGYYYFRDYYGKLIFGGGRNLAFEEEETTEFGINQQIKGHLISDLQSRILPDKDFEIIQEWSGIMAFGDTKEPIVKEVEQNVYAGVRLGGMGVAIGSMVGEELASMILKSL